mgnify:CR=1 FL=1
MQISFLRRILKIYVIFYSKFDKYLSTSEESNTTKDIVDKIHLACAALMIELSKADHSIDDIEINKALAPKSRPDPEK